MTERLRKICGKGRSVEEGGIPLRRQRIGGPVYVCTRDPGHAGACVGYLMSQPDASSARRDGWENPGERLAREITEALERQADSKRRDAIRRCFC